ncbi:Ent4p Ecym_8407 [Eremothecium cymbalariae DBVPG|uniref:ENTH domain-containing protein n=1 Tax=Eremothecium cymbalariae (strain CBS 270.75 / DBVPG 7215 / KCTC 17166 / NRRL Y-17582) TaxID=931890 RepID=G8JXV3_ERECY|nr:Hypothetical protein Ecym_8407 [Eremothecium cymbalariae DBVPG\
MPFLSSVRHLGSSSTTVKVKKATDDSEHNGAYGSLMNEIAILTYSPNTLREITQVLKKRLVGNYKKTPSKRAVNLLKTLTLIRFLVINGSEECIAWLRRHLVLIRSFQDFTLRDGEKKQMVNQIQLLSCKLCQLLTDSNLLEDMRKEITIFRTSITTPGRKSTDANYLLPHGTIQRKNTDNLFRNNTIHGASNSRNNEFLLINDAHTMRKAKSPGWRVGIKNNVDSNYISRLRPVREETLEEDLTGNSLHPVLG